MIWEIYEGYWESLGYWKRKDSVAEQLWQANIHIQNILIKLVSFSYKASSKLTLDSWCWAKHVWLTYLGVLSLLENLIKFDLVDPASYMAIPQT